MADWIKMRSSLDTDPAVFGLATELAIDELSVVGRLWKVWAWADTHSVDGNAVSVTSVTLDRITNCPGFAAALRKVGWLEGRDNALTFPHFDRHNGQSAKKRALTRDRVQNHRSATSPNGVTHDALPDKRRVEEKENPPKPPPAVAGRERETRKESKPTTAEALQLHALFNRRPETGWSEKEVKAFKLARPSLEEITLVAGYTTAERAKGEDGRHRRDLGTLLNNWPGEVDRARASQQQPTNGRHSGFAP